MLQRQMVQLCVVAMLVMAPAAVDARPANGNASGSASAPTQTAPVATAYPRGTCLSGGDCVTKCDQHAAVYTGSGHNVTMVGQCKNACGTQSVPGHPGEFMAKCVERGVRDLECVESLVALNLCLFQAAADPIESAKCTAAVSPSCL